MNASIVIIAAFAVFALAIGVMARRGRKLTLEQWAVGGRGFGSSLRASCEKMKAAMADSSPTHT